MILMDLIPVNPVEIFITEWWPAIALAVGALAIFAAMAIIKAIRKNKK